MWLILLKKKGILCDLEWPLRSNYESMNLWIYESMNLWIYESMNLWIYESMNLWIYESMNHLKKKLAFNDIWQKSHRPGNFRKLLVRKSTLLKKLFLTFFYILKTVLVDDLIFQFWVYSLKNVEFIDKIVCIFLLKLAHKSYLFTHIRQIKAVFPILMGL